MKVFSLPNFKDFNIQRLVMREPELEPRLGRAGAQKTELRLENGLGIFA